MADPLDKQLGEARAVIAGNPVLDGRDPVTGEPLVLSPGARAISTTSDGGPVGRYVAEEWRVAYDWRRLGLTEELIGAVAHEAELWDRWAHRQEFSYPPEKDLSVQALFSKTAALNKARERVSDLCEVSDKRVLDIGGTCKDSVYFLYSGAARVDQVEVSAQSQRLALDRLHAALTARGRTWEGRVFFHTIPAERLPFEDSVFDFAFSRSTIHHLHRWDAFREIHRVLKPGGRLFFLERYLGSLGHHAMRVWRVLRDVDRGTDLPLSWAELDSLNGIFSSAEWHIHNALEPLAYFMPSRARERLRKFQDKDDLPFALRRLLGTYCWATAQK